MVRPAMGEEMVDWNFQCDRIGGWSNAAADPGDRNSTSKNLSHHQQALVLMVNHCQFT